MTWTAFLETKSNMRSAGPLTMREEFMREEAISGSKSSSPASAMGSVSFAFSTDLVNKLKVFSSGGVNFIEIHINTEKETAELGASSTLAMDNMNMSIKV